MNITFGTKNNPVLPLPVYTSDNAYTSDPCPQSAAYTIASSTANCFNSTWITLTEDHTPGDIDGNMMLMNPEGNNLYIDTLHLCGGSTYQFEAFFINLDNAAACGGGATQPNITISIETPGGLVLASLPTIDIPAVAGAAVWTREAFFFTLPDASSDVVMRIKNNINGGCGNDLAIDDISIRPCGLSLRAAFAVAGPVPDTLHFCETDNKTVIINGSAQSGFLNTSFQWQETTDGGNSWADLPNASNPQQLTHTFTTAGRFQYRLTASAGANLAAIGCRTVSNALNVLVDAVPVPQAANTSPVCKGSMLAFSAKNGDFYQWTGPAGFSSSVSNPQIFSVALNNSGTYFVRVSTIGGCWQQDSTAVLVSDFPVVNAGRDTAICLGKSVSLQAGGGISYTWSPATGLSDTSIATPLATPIVTTSYMVTAGNQYHCMASDTVIISVLHVPTVSAGADAAICTGSSINLQGNGGGSYLWSPAAGLSAINIAQPAAGPVVTTLYILTVTDAHNCSAADSVLIKVFSKPVADAGPDKKISLGESTQLHGNASGDTSIYYWTPAQFINNANLLAPTVSPVNDMIYTLHVGSNSVCGIATDDVLVHVNKILHVPNAFSPNGDGINDTWHIEAIAAYPDAAIKVYNRYGQLVFTAKGYSRPWDGRLNGNLLPTGTYYYTIDPKKDLAPVSGWVAIIR